MLASLEEQMTLAEKRAEWFSELIGLVEDWTASCELFGVTPEPFQRFRVELMRMGGEADDERDDIKKRFDSELSRNRNWI